MTRRYLTHSIFWLPLIAYFSVLPVFAQIMYDERGPAPPSKCQQLEQQLANIWINGNNASSILPKLETRIKGASRKYHALKRQAERANCYEEFFIFGRSLRKTRRCQKFGRQMRQAKNEYERLEEEKRSLTNRGSRNSKRDLLLRQLAQHNCNPRYQDHQRRNSSNFSNFFWNNGEEYSPDDGSYTRNRQNREIDASIQPYATYRTMCVRLCDGFYFPVSFSALPSKFDQDTATCQNKCAAPTKLFVYRNPGAEIEQMIDLQGLAYADLPNAWKYRKKFVDGCSCKVQEYSLESNNAQNRKASQQWNTKTQR